MPCPETGRNAGDPLSAKKFIVNDCAWFELFTTKNPVVKSAPTAKCARASLELMAAPVCGPVINCREAKPLVPINRRARAATIVLDVQEMVPRWLPRAGKR